MFFRVTAFNLKREGTLDSSMTTGGDDPRSYGMAGSLACLSRLQTLVTSLVQGNASLL